MTFVMRCVGAASEAQGDEGGEDEVKMQAQKEQPIGQTQESDPRRRVPQLEQDEVKDQATRPRVTQDKRIAAYGEFIVQRTADHAHSSLHRGNIHKEYNCGLCKGYRRRWANMGVESINRNTNRCALCYEM